MHAALSPSPLFSFVMLMLIVMFVIHQASIYGCGVLVSLYKDPLSLWKGLNEGEHVVS